MSAHSGPCHLTASMLDAFSGLSKQSARLLQLQHKIYRYSINNNRASVEATQKALVHGLGLVLLFHYFKARNKNSGEKKQLSSLGFLMSILALTYNMPFRFV
jgi:hypothetical protein